MGTIRAFRCLTGSWDPTKGPVEGNEKALDCDEFLSDCIQYAVWSVLHILVLELYSRTVALMKA